MSAVTTALPPVCPRCRAVLPAARCPVCREAGHLDYLLAELADCADHGRIPRAEADALLADYQQRREALLAPLPLEFELPLAPPPVIRPRPSAPPEPASEPTEWQRLVSATGQLGWLYAVGVLFIVAALGWLVLTSLGTPLGRWILALVVLCLAGAFWAGGWFVRSRLGLHTGGEALLAVGTLLVPAGLFAVKFAVGLGGYAADAAIWLAGALLAAAAVRRGRLASQLALANLLAVPALYRLAGLVWPAQPWPACAAALPLLAGVNVWVSARCRRGGEEWQPLAVAARWSASLVAALAAMLLLSTGGALGPQAFGSLLLGASLIALAHEMERPELVALAAATWYLATVARFEAGSEAIVAVMLLAVGAAVRRDERFDRWTTGSAMAVSALMILRWLPEYLVRDVPPLSAVACWLLAAVYAAMAWAWRRRQLLAAAVVVATVAALMTTAATGLGRAFNPTLLTLLAAAVMVAAAGVKAEWGGAAVSAALAPQALTPLVVGLLSGAIAWQTEPFGIVLPAGLALLAAAAFVLSYQIGRREVLYLAVLHGALAGLIIADWLPIEIVPAFAMALWAAALVAAAMLANEHLQPLEVSGVILASLAGAMVIGTVLITGATVSDLAALLVIAAVMAVPALPRLASRSHLPELLETGFRPWAALLAAAGAAACASLLLGAGPGLGAAAAALAMALPSLRGGTGPWSTVLPRASLAVATAACLDIGANPPWTLLLCQAALLLAGRWTEAGPVVGLVSWLFFRAGQAFGLDPQWGTALAVDAALGVAYLALIGRSQAAPACGAVVLASAHAALGGLLGIEAVDLWFGLYVVAMVAAGMTMERLDRTAAGGVYAVAGLAAVGSVAGAVAAERVVESNLLLYGYTALLGLLTRLRGLPPRAVLSLGSAALAYSCGTVAVPAEGLSLTAFGARLAVVVLNQAFVAAALRGRPTWCRQLLEIASVTSVISLVAMFTPADRPTVFGLAALCAASLTTTWTTGDRRLNDLGFGFAWLAGSLILIDLANHGRDELALYRSLDLYVAPIGLYLLLAVEQRASDPLLVRRTAVLMILGSLLVAAFAAASPWHDVVLFACIAAAAWFGIQRTDPVVRAAGLAAFGLYLVGFVWQYKAASRWLLIPVLLLLGGVAIGYALRREREERAGEG